MKNNIKLSIIALVSDIILLFVVVFSSTFVRTNTIPFNTYYLLFFIAWILISLAFGKYRFTHHRLKNEIISLLINALSVWGLLSLYVISLEKYNKNYNDVYFQILIVLLIEIIARLIYYFVKRKKYSHAKEPYFSYLSLRNKKWTMMFFDLLAVFISFMIVIWVKPASLRIYLPSYYNFLFVVLILEFILNLLTQKHRLDKKIRHLDYIKPILKSNALIIIFLAIVIYLLKLFNLSRLIVFGTVVLATIFEVAFAVYISIHTRIMENTDESEKILKITPFDEKYSRKDDHKIVPFPKLANEEQTIRHILSERLNNYPQELCAFIDKNIVIDGVDQKELSVYNTQTLFNIETIPSNSIKLLINFHEVNDFKRINDYFSVLNGKLEMGGYILGRGETISGIYTKTMEKYSKPVAWFVYLMHFIFRRVLPKLPLTKEINYVLTNGQNRTMSKTEILGRLVFSGFKIIDTIEINNIFYFLAAKVNVPYEHDIPTYGPFISLKRIGKDGKIFKAYKLRTMHPYAEYIQDYVYETGGGTIDGDGFKNDFRITGWGKIFRKLWIDELPMIINWIRGDLKLVGVRPLSQHKYSLLDKDIQEMRVKFLPGLVPPFYADIPNNLEEIQDSERRYLEKYEKHKIRTDFQYFFKAFYNIVFKGARSK